MKKKLIALVIIGAGLLGLSGCSTKQVDLKAKGMDMIALMDERASDEQYASYLSGNEELNKIIAEFGQGEYTNPTMVYEIKIPAEKFFEQMNLDISDMSEALKEDLYKKIDSGIGAMLNRQSGATNLAATSVLSGSTAFEGKLETTVIYLYLFGDAGNPAIVVFAPAEGNVIMASGLFLADKEWNAVASEQEVQARISLILGGMEDIEVRALNE